MFSRSPNSKSRCLTMNELLVKVRASSLNFIDTAIVSGPWVLRPMSGLRKPKFTGFGLDFAGVVEAVGKNVTEFKPGDEVFGGKLGSVAEYLCVRKDRVALKPANVTFEQAGAVKHAGLTALQGLRAGKIHAGQKVLINGASGGVGHVRSADREGVRHRSHRRVQHAQRGDGAYARGRSRHRLHERRLHQSRGALRPALRQRPKSLHGRTAPRPDFRRHLRSGWDWERRRTDRTATGTNRSWTRCAACGRASPTTSLFNTRPR